MCKKTPRAFSRRPPPDKMTQPTKKIGGMSNKPGLSLGIAKLPTANVERNIDKESQDGSAEARTHAGEDSLTKKPTGFFTKLDLGGLIRAPKPNVFLVKPPNTEGHTFPTDENLPPGVDGISRRFSVGFADMCGTRDTMEDKMAMKGQFRGLPDEDFFGVFDGHSGSTAAAFAAQSLYKKLEGHLDAIDDEPFATIQACHDAFIDCHQEMKHAGVDSGTTGIIVYFQSDKFYIANVGDSRVIVSQGGRSKPLSIDQKPNLPSEKKRILKLGGWVTGGRVQSKLAVARALGDFPLNPYICCEPEVFGPWYFSADSNGAKDSQNFDFMIIGCDGLWDVCDNETAVKIVHGCLTPQEAAVKLRTYAQDQRTRDNVSVIVLFFPGYIAGKYKHLQYVPEPEPLKSARISRSSSSSSSQEVSSSGSEESGSDVASEESESSEEEEDDK